jgi:hypothetical protein
MKTRSGAGVIVVNSEVVGLAPGLEPTTFCSSRARDDRDAEARSALFTFFAPNRLAILNLSRIIRFIDKFLSGELSSHAQGMIR